MDPATREELNGFDIYMHNFKRRYCTNKSPLGVFLHPAWLLIRDNTVKLEKFIQTVSQFDDVFFVSGLELINYMKNPKKASEYQQECATVSSCFPPKGMYAFQD